jgi:hypothetical protein
MRLFLSWAARLACLALLAASLMPPSLRACAHSDGTLNVGLSCACQTCENPNLLANQQFHCCSSDQVETVLMDRCCVCSTIESPLSKSLGQLPTPQCVSFHDTRLLALAVPLNLGSIYLNQAKTIPPIETLNHLTVQLRL